MKDRIQNIWPKTTDAKYTALLLLGSFGALFASVIYTSYKSALANQYVADALADNYMFMGISGFDQVVAPGTHTYLLKWPLFILHNAMGFNFATYILVCVGLALLTYFASLYFVYKVAPQRKIIAAAAVALALIVLLTKPFPTDASFSLVGLAMPTIRNIEYIWYFGYLLLLLKLTGYNRRFWLTALLFGVLAASDPFFSYLALGAGSIFLARHFWQTRKFSFSQPATLLLANAIGGVVIGQLLLRLSDILRIVDISVFKASPYSFVASIQELWNGILGAIQGTLINFGGDFFGQQANVAVLPILWNAAITITCAVVCYQIVRILPPKKISTTAESRLHFVQLAIYSTIIAYLSLVLSTHDGVPFLGGIRYIYIAVFTGIIALSYVAYQQNWYRLAKLSGVYFVVVGVLFLLAIPTAKTYQANAYQQQQRNFADRQYKVLGLLQENKVASLYGDFWSIYPIKFIGENKDASYTLNAIPIEGCASPKPYFVNKTWYQPQSSPTRSALYVERDSLDAEIFHGCDLKDYVATYGTPTLTIPVRTDTSGKILDYIFIYDYDIRSKFGPMQEAKF